MAEWTWKNENFFQINKDQAKPMKENQGKRTIFRNIQSPRTSGAPEAALTATSKAIVSGYHREDVRELVELKESEKWSGKWEW